MGHRKKIGLEGKNSVRYRVECRREKGRARVERKGRTCEREGRRKRTTGEKIREI